MGVALWLHIHTYKGTTVHRFLTTDTIMPSAENIKRVLSFASLAILFVSLGAAGTSLGLLQANTNNGVYATCHFFITHTQAMNSSLYNYNVPTCKLSIASATIATICLALLTAIELISVSFKINVKT